MRISILNIHFLISQTIFLRKIVQHETTGFYAISPSPLIDTQDWLSKRHKCCLGPYLNNIHPFQYTYIQHNEQIWFYILQSLQSLTYQCDHAHTEKKIEGIQALTADLTICPAGSGALQSQRFIFKTTKATASICQRTC